MLKEEVLEKDMLKEDMSEENVLEEDDIVDENGDIAVDEETKYVKVHAKDLPHKDEE